MRSWLKLSNNLQYWTRKALITVSDWSPPGTFYHRETWASYLPHALVILSANDLMSKQSQTRDTAPSRVPVQELLLESTFQDKVAL